MNTITLLTLVPLLTQDPAPDTTPPAGPAESAESGSHVASAEALRSRIQGMRMKLLLGGDQVRAAEQEAVRFYSHKQEVVDGRLDTIDAELTEKRATYDVAVGRALEAEGGESRRSAMAEASQLSAQVNELEWEAHELGRKREELSGAITSVQARDRDRERLVAQLETSSGFELELGIPMSTIGLAPASGPPPASSPFDDESLVNDLLARDLRGARTLLYDMDPVRYWQHFPLRPPGGALAELLAFPLPDLPEYR